MAAIRALIFFVISLIAVGGLGPIEPRPANAQTAPIGDPMPARITFSGSAFIPDNKLLNETTLELSLPPPPNMRPIGLPKDDTFRVTGTAAYSYTILPPGCQTYSVPASGTFNYATQATRHSVPTGTDTFTFDVPPLPQMFSNVVILRCQSGEQAIWPVGMPLADMFVSYDVVDGFSFPYATVPGAGIGIQLSSKLDLACPVQTGSGNPPTVTFDGPPEDQPWPVDPTVDNSTPAATLEKMNTAMNGNVKGTRGLTVWPGDEDTFKIDPSLPVDARFG